MPLKNGLAVIISSPSGAGKTTITKSIIKKIKNSYLSVSCTTRKPRKGEKDGIDYFFISKKKFFNLKKNKKFLETAKVYDNYYGTLKKEVKNNKIIFFDVDWQGAKNLKKNIQHDCHSFFLIPPSVKELKKRLLKRHNDNPKIALKRFSSAKKDISHWHEYDYVFINRNLNVCVKEILKKIYYLIDEKKRFASIKEIIKKL